MLRNAAATCHDARGCGWSLGAVLFQHRCARRIAKAHDQLIMSDVRCHIFVAVPVPVNGHGHDAQSPTRERACLSAKAHGLPTERIEIYTTQKTGARVFGRSPKIQGFVGILPKPRPDPGFRALLETKPRPAPGFRALLGMKPMPVPVGRA